MGWSRRAIINFMKTLLKTSLLALCLASCQGTSQPAIPPTVTVQPTETLSPQVQTHQNEITAIWKNSSHAQASEPVACANCHVTENGITAKEVSWRNPQTGQYEAVPGADALCGKCHEITPAESAHQTFTCKDCHDPHRVDVGCTDSGCHAAISTVFYDLPATPTGGHPMAGAGFCGGANCHSVATAVAVTSGSIHGPEHAQVSCDACHAADPVQVGPEADSGKWLSRQQVEVNGELVKESVISHNIQLKVECVRCHYEDNPWGLSLVTGAEFWK
jgi:hypothetical protein